MPNECVELSLRRTSELTARLALTSPILVPDEREDPEKVQFERIVGKGIVHELNHIRQRGDSLQLRNGWATDRHNP